MQAVFTGGCCGQAPASSFACAFLLAQAPVLGYSSSNRAPVPPIFPSRRVLAGRAPDPGIWPPCARVCFSAHGPAAPRSNI